MENGKYANTFRVRYSEIDEELNLPVFGIMNYLQDVATFHGEDTGVGLIRNIGKGVAWILADTQLHIYRAPRFDETIRVSTWSQSLKGMIALRSYTIDSADGERLVTGTAHWIFMDMKNFRPMKITPEEKEAYGEHPEFAPEEDLGSRKVKPSGEAEIFESFPVREINLDTNRHVNNAEYVRIASGYLPEGFSCAHLRVEYKKQAVLHDVIVPKLYRDGGKYFVCLDAEDGETYFAAEFTPRENTVI